eukprot:TRINITY_DN2288_c0_g1_i1.p1 TRINITY_DN2288_c0_g1~~TRINITY_DN2288_c0_g1_i1.p1  ORF type:complete len:764 (-),score=277.72 TRINITY_DN2288_c0_g1_i1:30-2297(-)
MVKQKLHSSLSAGALEGDASTRFYKAKQPGFGPHPALRKALHKQELQRSGGWVVGSEQGADGQELGPPMPAWGTVQLKTHGPAAAMVKGWPKWAIPGFLEEVAPRLEGCRQRLLAAEYELQRAESGGLIEMPKVQLPELSRESPMHGMENDEFAILAQEDEELMAQCTFLEGELGSLGNKLQHLDSGHVVVRQKRNDFSKRLKESQAREVALHTQASKLNRGLKASKGEAQDVRGKLGVSEAMAKDLKVQLSASQGKEKNLAAEVADLQQQLSSARSEAEDLGEKLKAAEAEKERLNELLRESEASHQASQKQSAEHIGKLEEAARQLEADRDARLAEGAERLQQLQDEHAALQQEMERRLSEAEQRRVSELDTAKAKAAEEAAAMSEQAAKEAHAKAEEAAEPIRRRSVLMESQLAELETNLKAKEQTHEEEGNRLKGEVEKLRAELEACQQGKETEEKRVVELETEVEKLRQDHAEKDDHATKLEAEVEELRQGHSEKGDHAAKLEAEVEELRRGHSEKGDHAAKLEAEVEELRRGHSEKGDHAAKLEAEVEELRRGHSEKGDHAAKLEAEVEELRRQADRVVKLEAENEELRRGGAGKASDVPAASAPPEEQEQWLKHWDEVEALHTAEVPPLVMASFFQAGGSKNDLRPARLRLDADLMELTLQMLAPSGPPKRLSLSAVAGIECSELDPDSDDTDPPLAVELSVEEEGDMRSLKLFAGDEHSTEALLAALSHGHRPGPGDLMDTPDGSPR